MLVLVGRNLCHNEYSTRRLDVVSCWQACWPLVSCTTRCPTRSLSLQRLFVERKRNIPLSSYKYKSECGHKGILFYVGTETFYCFPPSTDTYGTFCSSFPYQSDLHHGWLPPLGIDHLNLRRGTSIRGYPK